MATFNIYRNGNLSHKSDYLVVEEFEGAKEDAIIRMIEEFAGYYPELHFPNEEETAIKDCDGDVIWEEGDTRIGTDERYFYIEEI